MRQGNNRNRDVTQRGIGLQRTVIHDGDITPGRARGAGPLPHRPGNAAVTHKCARIVVDQPHPVCPLPTDTSPDHLSLNDLIAVNQPGTRHGFVWVYLR
jgi:hypothetical protein